MLEVRDQLDPCIRGVPRFGIEVSATPGNQLDVEKAPIVVRHAEQRVLLGPAQIQTRDQMGHPVGHALFLIFRRLGVKP